MFHLSQILITFISLSKLNLVILTPPPPRGPWAPPSIRRQKYNFSMLLRVVQALHKFIFFRPQISATLLQIMFSCAISGTSFCGVVNSRDQHHLYQFRLDMSHPCSGSLVEVSLFPVVDQNLNTTLRHLTQDIWEIQDRLFLARREYVSHYIVYHI